MRSRTFSIFCNFSSNCVKFLAAIGQQQQLQQTLHVARTQTDLCVCVCVLSGHCTWRNTTLPNASTSALKGEIRII